MFLILSKFEFHVSVLNFLGTVHKGCPSQVGEGFVQCIHFADKGKGRGLQMRSFALFDAKNFGFSKFMLCPTVHTDKGG